MRTLVLTPDFPPATGGIQHLVDRVVSLAPGLECRVLTVAVPGKPEPAPPPGVAVERVAPLPRPLPRPATVAKLNAVAVREALSFRPAAVLNAHIVLSPSAALIRRALGIPVVQYFYGKEIGARPGLAGFAARRADASIAISAYTRDLILAAGGPAERITLIHPGVDVGNGRSRLRAERPTVLTIARMEDRYKGHDVMVRAMALVVSRVPGAQWVVIGDGPLRAVIAELASSTGLGEEAIRLLGAVDDEERDAWLGRADVFAMPSRMPAGGFAGEGFGIVYLEANVHGCPVVAGGVGGTLDAVVDGETGLLVDPSDHVEVADALVTLLRDRRLREEMGAAGARRAEGFAWPVAARQVAELLARVVDGGTRAA